MSMHAVVSLFEANVNMCDQVATKSLFVMSNTPERSTQVILDAFYLMPKDHNWHTGEIN